jgi:transcriptional regulator GlxA family with amidase domain
LTLREIAASVCVREQYLSESLNRISGLGFRDHLRAVRVLHAAAALTDAEDTVEQIALACGYACAPQLNRHFKDLLHVTPTRFRWLCDANFHGAYTKPTEKKLRILPTP